MNEIFTTTRKIEEVEATQVTEKGQIRTTQGNTLIECEHDLQKSFI